MSEENSNKNNATEGNQTAESQDNLEHAGNAPLGEETSIDQLITQKLHEQRSLETLLRIQFLEYKSSINSRLAFWGTVVTLALAVLGFFGYSAVKEFIRSQVGTQLEAKLITPEVNKTVKDALDTQTKDFVTEKINPLEKSIGNMRNDLGNLQSIAKIIDPLNKVVKELSVDTKSAKSDLRDISEETAILRLYYDVRRGERSALNDMIKLAKENVSPKGRLSKSLLDDLNLYFRDYKYSLQHQIVINKKTQQPIRPAAEEIYDKIKMYKDEDSSMREAEVNEISPRKLVYFVQNLVRITQDDPNLKVACRAARAIENLTEKHFEDYPPYDEIQRWWDKVGSKEKKYMNPLYRLDEARNLFAKKEFDKALGIFEEVSSSRTGMCVTHFNIATIYLTKTDTNKAKEHLKISIEECDAQIPAMFLYASLLYQDGKKEEVIDILSKIKPYVDDQPFEKQCRSIFAGLANEERFKILFEGK